MGAHPSSPGSRPSAQSACSIVLLCGCHQPHLQEWERVANVSYGVSGSKVHELLILVLLCDYKNIPRPTKSESLGWHPGIYPLICFVSDSY